MGDLLETCQSVRGSDAILSWASKGFLLEKGVGDWVELPLWIPASDPNSAGFFTFDVSLVFAAGLSYRPLEETVHTTLEWEAARPHSYEWCAGFAPHCERELLDTWRTQQ
jgi:2'-hydroxyisoflavone reductase